MIQGISISKACQNNYYLQFFPLWKRSLGEKFKRFSYLCSLRCHPLPTFVRQLRLQIAFIEFLRDLFASERKSNHAALVALSPPQRRCCRNKKSDALGNIENWVSFFARCTQSSSSTLCVAWIEFPSPWGIRRSALMTQKCQWNLLNSGRNGGGGGGRSSSELLCPEIAN
jgi:hypothetical protein